MAQAQQLSFSEVELQRLFGHEAAEDEDPERLREYYFKTNTYNQVMATLPLRILVGHKGIGKSALFQVAIAEEREAGQITILVRPDDVADLGSDPSNFLKTIREWKVGLSGIIARKVMAAVGASDDSWSSRWKQWSGTLANFLDESFQGDRRISVAPAKQFLIRNFLKTNRISVYIDDLDRGWQGLSEDNLRISALLNAVRDITSESRGINFRISLRSDVYYLVRTSDESTDKLEGSVIWQTWTNHEIFVLLVKRIESFFGRNVDESDLLSKPQPQLSHYLDPVMEPNFLGQGLWDNVPTYRVLMSLIRKRPRDLVKLCTLAGRNARQHEFDRIRTRNFQDIFEEYSQGRLQDTVNEFRSELPDLERLLLSMKPSRKERTGKEGYTYTTDALVKKINDIREQGQFRLANGEVADSKRLAAFMYKINFLTARKEKGELIQRRYFEENRYLSSSFVDFGYDWEIHPAYRWALQPSDVLDIFKNVGLTADA